MNIIFSNNESNTKLKFLILVPVIIISFFLIIFLLTFQYGKNWQDFPFLTFIILVLIVVLPLRFLIGRPTVDIDLNNSSIELKDQSVVITKGSKIKEITYKDLSVLVGPSYSIRHWNRKLVFADLKNVDDKFIFEARNLVKTGSNTLLNHASELIDILRIKGVKVEATLSTLL